jgi:hypothetical protein
MFNYSASLKVHIFKDPIQSKDIGWRRRFKNIGINNKAFE